MELTTSSLHQLMLVGVGRGNRPAGNYPAARRQFLHARSLRRLGSQMWYQTSARPRLCSFRRGSKPFSAVTKTVVAGGLFRFAWVLVCMLFLPAEEHKKATGQ